MKTLKLTFVTLVLAFAHSGCKECIKCEVEYMLDGSSSVEEWCENEARADLDIYYRGMESVKTIKPGWTCE